ncbi:MAG: nucleoside triphosphate pyrophosphohydrolase [Bacteroidetes bacterium]|nr:MAG: nucleoside triphosphate pyrophosphohydrolase [Bacteroidota bacterium]
MEREAEELALFGELVYLMRRLRRDCPWDAKQTVESLRQYTIEEVHELADAIVDHSDVNIRKELGDLIMHVVFYALIGEEHGRFSLAEMLKGENEKLIYRHPHVFGDNPSTDADEVERQWEALKLKEKGGNRRVLEGVPRSLPALVKAMRIQEKAAAAGFDWTMREDVWGKVEEELAETREAVMEEDIPHMQEEFGDLLFAVINAARLYDVDPAFALEEANRKFMRRFNHVETRTLESGRQLADMSLDEMEAFWCEAKRIERGEQ